MRQKGFTLVEAVVATSLFVFVVSSILGVYIAALHLDRKSRAQRAVVRNSQYILDFMAKEIRNGRIDYAAYPGGNPSEANDIRIINQAGDAEIFALSASCDFTVQCDLTLTKNGVTTNLNSSDVRISAFDFFISPDVDPLTPAKLEDRQPFVTLGFELTSNSGNSPSEQKKMSVQTTIVERYYPSRQ